MMAVQNIDPVYFLTPLIVVGFSAGLVLYWRLTRRFSPWVLLLSLLAYAGAIAIKVVFQALTLNPFLAVSGGDAVALGAYYGLQTVVFEVGGAFLVARYAFKRGKIAARDAEGYGIGLAFWENGVLLGGSLLLDYLLFFLVRSGGGSAAQQLYGILTKDSPALFYPPSAALPIIGYAVLERVSSLFVHFSWGVLCVLAVAYRRKLFLWLALPMGLIDFLPPFAGGIGAAAFEGIVFAVSLLCLTVALASTRQRRRTTEEIPRSPRQVSRAGSLFRTNFRRAVGFGRIYLVMALVLPLLLGQGLGVNIPSDASAPPIVSELFPIMLPVFASLGGVGALMVFVSDKSRGVYEYLIAYGVSTYDIFWSIVLAALGLVSVVLLVSLSLTAAILLATGGSVTAAEVELLLVYSIPLSYAAAAFMSMSGMVWSFLTTRISGVNSPVGLAPILGIAPVLVVLILSSMAGPGTFTLLTAGATLALVVAVASMMVVANRKMVRERLLSEA